MSTQQNQQGSIVMIVLVLAAVSVCGFLAWRGLNRPTITPTLEHQSSSQAASDTPMKSIGFNLGYYDSATNKAGDMVFTKIALPYNQIWSDFGQQDPRSPNDPTKRNPQPTFILPLGTKVQSLIDGVVTKVETLYSGDSTVWVATSKNATLSFETEHVSNVLVKEGDTVKAGQVIAEVSPHDSQNHPGFGILEIGVLGQKDNKPLHTCPFQYLDASVKGETLKKISALYTAWETYLGKPDLYNQDQFAMPGCVTLDGFAG